MTQTLSQMAMHDAKNFDAMVARLRRLGVVKLGALVLGPLPHEPARTEGRETDPHAEARRLHEIRFASTSIKPPFVPPTGNATRDMPRAIVQRLERDEAAGGKSNAR